jgi:hypothetical protein
MVQRRLALAETDLQQSMQLSGSLQANADDENRKRLGALNRQVTLGVKAKATLNGRAHADFRHDQRLGVSRCRLTLKNSAGRLNGPEGLAA